MRIHPLFILALASSAQATDGPVVPVVPVGPIPSVQIFDGSQVANPPLSPVLVSPPPKRSPPAAVQPVRPVVEMPPPPPVLKTETELPEPRPRLVRGEAKVRKPKQTPPTEAVVHPLAEVPPVETHVLELAHLDPSEAFPGAPGVDLEWAEAQPEPAAANSPAAHEGPLDDYHGWTWIPLGLLLVGLGLTGGLALKRQSRRGSVDPWFTQYR